MKKILMFIFIIILTISGCTEVTPEVTKSLPTAEPIPTATDLDQSQPSADTTPSPEPKITSDFKDAPKAAEIEKETGMQVSQVLLQDTSQYSIPMGDYFAVALEEDAQKQYRWLLASDDGKFKYVEETHLNGYRVFIFEILEKGESSLLFELTQGSDTLVETLSYQLMFT